MQFYFVEFNVELDSSKNYATNIFVGRSIVLLLTKLAQSLTGNLRYQRSS